MIDAGFTLEPGLFKPEPPFRSDFDRKRPGAWAVTDGIGRTVARSRTRRGSSAALQTLYANPEITTPRSQP